MTKFSRQAILKESGIPHSNNSTAGKAQNKPKI